MTYFLWFAAMAGLSLGLTLALLSPRGWVAWFVRLLRSLGLGPLAGADPELPESVITHHHRLPDGSVWHRHALPDFHPWSFEAAHPGQDPDLAP